MRNPLWILESMKPKINPKVLATGLFNVADDSNMLERVRDALSLINGIITENGHFRAFVQSKKIKRQSKSEILKTVLGESGHFLVNEIVSHLSGSNAPKSLNKIVFLFNSMYREKKSIIEVKGVVAKEMDQSQLDSLKTSLDKILGKQTELSMEVDSTLIGGIKLRIENTFLDASIQNQLQILRAELLQI